MSNENRVANVTLSRLQSLVATHREMIVSNWREVNFRNFFICDIAIARSNRTKKINVLFVKDHTKDKIK